MPVTMTFVKPRPAPAILPSIPHEILSQIASLIDLPAAKALATTCKSLRDAGEMRIWRKLELTHDPRAYCK
jgi:hypothetical protein